MTQTRLNAKSLQALSFFSQRQVEASYSFSLALALIGVRFNRNSGGFAGTRRSLERLLFGRRHGGRTGRDFDGTSFDIRIVDSLRDFP